MMLIGDIGNTDTKICLLNSNYRIIKRSVLPTKKINKSILHRKLNFIINKKNSINKSLFCSVVPSKFLLIKSFLQKNFNIKSIELKNLNLNPETFLLEATEIKNKDDLKNRTNNAFIKGIFATVVETKWELSNFDVSLDNKSAHISYFNKGLITTTQNESIHMNWMESVYMVVDDGELKLKFLQSDVVNQEVEESS